MKPEDKGIEKLSKELAESLNLPNYVTATTIQNNSITVDKLNQSSINTNPDPFISGTYNHSLSPNYSGQHTHPIYQQPQPQTYTTGSPMAQEYLEEIADIAKLLGVKPGGAGIMVRGNDGEDYSLMAIIKAHLDLMMQLNVFAAKKGTNDGE